MFFLLPITLIPMTDEEVRMDQLTKEPLTSWEARDLLKFSTLRLSTVSICFVLFLPQRENLSLTDHLYPVMEHFYPDVSGLLRYGFHSHQISIQ